MRAQLTQERQKSYTLDQKVKILQRDHKAELQQVLLKFQSEQEKSTQLENYIQELTKSDSSALFLENSLLKSRIQSIESDYESIKSKLFSDFSGKETHIFNLSESNQLLEEELKSYQELSLSKTKQSLQKFSEMEAKIADLMEKNHLLEKKLLKQSEKNEEEIESLRQSLDYAQEQFANKKKENIRMIEKIEAEDEANEKLRDHIYVLEEKIRIMETENDELILDISNRERKLKSLTSDMDCVGEDLIDQKNENFDNLVREIKSLNLLLKNAREENAMVMKNKEESEELYEKVRQETLKKLEVSDRERKSMGEQLAVMKEKYEELQKARNLKEEQIRAAKDEIIKDLQSRILILKSQNNELESTLQELQDQIQVTRVSAGIEISLSDELNQMRESYSSRCSTPRKNFIEANKFDKSPLDGSEKDLQLQVLKAENLSLKHQIENIVPSLLVKLPEYQAIAAEKKRLENELVLSKEMWANENNILRTLLEETEAITINANLRYAEAATDRDLYQKMYLDSKKIGLKRSWFKKNKS